MVSRRILMLVGDYVEDYEVMVPFQALQILGHIVHTACPDKKAGQKIKTAIHDFEEAQTYSEKLGHNFTVNTTFEELNENQYDALVIPGGRAPEYIRLNENVIKITRHFSITNKPIAAICHGVQVLLAADVITGKSCTAYPSLKPDVINAGGNWLDLPLDRAYVDDRLVTAPTWSAIPEWIKLFQMVLEKTYDPFASYYLSQPRLNVFH